MIPDIITHSRGSQQTVFRVGTGARGGVPYWGTDSNWARSNEPNVVSKPSNSSKAVQNIVTDFPLAFADNLIGILLILLTAVGILSNLPSFLYFWKRRKKTIHDFLYSVISVLNGMTCALCFPVIASLMNSRSEMLFGNSVVCMAWPSAFYLMIRLAMLLVIFVSLTRTIAIVKPSVRCNVRKEHVLTAMIGYALFLVSIDLVFLSTGVIETEFIKRVSHCGLMHRVSKTSEDGVVVSEWSTIWAVAFHLEVILPCLVVFVSFLLTAVALSRRKAMQSEDEKKFRRISVTIALFTAMFLVSYLPCLALQVYDLVSIFNGSLGITDIRFKHYVPLLLQFVLPVLNAAVNPCLYFLRMPRYQKWFKDAVESLKTESIALTQ